MHFNSIIFCVVKEPLFFLLFSSFFFFFLLLFFCPHEPISDFLGHFYLVLKVESSNPNSC